jgi:hypothetical protein
MTLSKIESNHGTVAVSRHRSRICGLSGHSRARATPYGGYFPLRTHASTQHEVDRDLSDESAERRRPDKPHSWWSVRIAFFAGRSFRVLLVRFVRFGNALTWTFSNKTD